MMTRAPEKLKKGDRAGIIPPAKSIHPGYISKAVEVLESWGLDVILSANIHSRYHQFAGNDEERISAFQEMLDAKDIKCIFSARGGYGTTRILDRLDFSKFLRHPKWIVGYSDITPLLSRMYQMGIQSIHGPMPINFSDPGIDDSLNRLKNLLFSGVNDPIVFTGHPRNKPGKARGPVVGGNLSLFTNCIGTADDISTDDCILFLEDVDVFYFRFDRMMVQLKRAGKLNGLKGLIIGHCTDMHDNDDPFGSDIQELVLDHIREFDYPVCFGAPIGHEIPNFPVPVGRTFSLEVSQQEVILKQIE